MPSRRHSSATLAAKPIQHDADFLLGRILLARRPANVSHDPLGRQFGGSGFLAHLHSSTLTMSQKSSFPQTLESVSQALTPDTRKYETGSDLAYGRCKDSKRLHLTYRSLG